MIHFRPRNRQRKRFFGHEDSHRQNHEIEIYLSSSSRDRFNYLFERQMMFVPGQQPVDKNLIESVLHNTMKTL